MALLRVISGYRVNGKQEGRHVQLAAAVEAADGGLQGQGVGEVRSAQISYAKRTMVTTSCLCYAEWWWKRTRRTIPWYPRPRPQPPRPRLPRRRYRPRLGRGPSSCRPHKAGTRCDGRASTAPRTASPLGPSHAASVATATRSTSRATTSTAATHAGVSARPSSSLLLREHGSSGASASTSTPTTTLAGRHTSALRAAAPAPAFKGEIRELSC